MKSKTVLHIVLGGVAGLALAMGTMAFAQNTDHMGNTTTGGGMMGQTIQKTNTTGGHGYMHETTAPQKTTYGGMHTQSNIPVGTHHASFNKAPANTPCHSDTTAKG